MKRTELAYIAGVVDGDGSIQFGKAGRPREALFADVIVYNSDRTLLEWLKFSFGGTINRDARGELKWRITHQKAAEFLKLILPYLKLKRAQAEIAVQFQGKVRHGHKVRADNVVLEEAHKILMDKAKGKNEEN